MLKKGESISSMGNQFSGGMGQHGIFPHHHEESKKAMIKFEMNLLAKGNKQPTASNSLRQLGAGNKQLDSQQ